MRLQEYNRPSTILIVLSAVILVLGIGLAFFSAFTAQDLRHDAGIINNAGSLRGGMQRLAKLVISRPDIRYGEHIAELDNLILQLNVVALPYKENGKDHRFLQGVKELNKEWSKMKLLILEYQKNPSEEQASSLLEASEDSWDTANNVVFLTQYVTDKKVEGISRIFYLLLVSNVTSAVLVISVILFRVRNKLEYESSHDMLTGLLNRRSYEIAITTEAARTVRYNKPVSLILFDIDHFKQVNDTFGHRVGDEVLKKVAQLIQSTTRQVDLTYRVGGEEFAIISPDTDLEGARQQAEKLRKCIEVATFDLVGKLKISLGVAQYLPRMTTTELYQQADKALYLAKNSGRNRVEVYSSEKEGA